MGSSGTGNFSDYPGSRGGSSGGGGGGAGGGGTGSGRPNRCEDPVGSVSLEEVDTSEYVEEHETLPRIGTRVAVRGELVGGRLAVETEGKREVVGLLPTRLNYLRTCINKGYEYSGKIEAVDRGPVSSIRIEFDG